MSYIRRFSILLLLLGGSFAQAEEADDFVLDWVAKYAQELNVRFGSRPFEQIGWADGLQSAVKLAKEHKRPIFLFTLDGYFETGRC